MGNDGRYAVAEILPIMLEVLKSGGEFRLFPRGTSMLPLIREGVDSVALVAPDRILKGDICLYRRENGQFVLHRVVKVAKDGTLSFLGDHQYVVEEGIPASSVIARVAAVYRGERRISPSPTAYRTLCLIPPTRFLRFFPYRVKDRIKKGFRK